MGLPAFLRSISLNFPKMPKNLAKKQEEEIKRRKNMTSSRERWAEKRAKWFKTTVLDAPVRRALKRQMKYQGESASTSQVSIPSSRKTKPAEDIELILKEIGPHPVACSPPAVERKGRIRNLDHFPDFSRLLHCLDMMESDVPSGDHISHVQYTDTQGVDFLLTRDDLLQLKSRYLYFIYISALILEAFCSLKFSRQRQYLHQQSPCAGGIELKDSESEVIRVRQTVKFSDLMQMPSTSFCNSYITVTQNSILNCEDDITKCSIVPTVANCEKMLKEISQCSMVGWKMMKSSLIS